MRRGISIILMVVASGASGKATAVCARMLCRMETPICCCHRASGQLAVDESLGDKEGSMIGIATKSTKPPSTPQSPSLEKALSCCCGVSLPPHERAVELLPKVSGDTFNPKDHDQALAWALVVANPPPQQAHYSAVTIDFHLDRSDVYLRTAALRI